LFARDGAGGAFRDCQRNVFFILTNGSPRVDTSFEGMRVKASIETSDRNEVSRQDEHEVRGSLAYVVGRLSNSRRFLSGKYQPIEASFNL
jgi:hypothetical protein